jgi:hypothetical protein
MPVNLIPFLMIQNSWALFHSPAVSGKYGGSGLRPYAYITRILAGRPVAESSHGGDDCVAEDAVTYQPVSCIEFPDTGSNRQADSISEECAHAFRRAPTAPVACEITGKLEVFALYKQLRNLKVEQVPIGKLPPYAKNAQKPSFFNRLGGCSVLKEQGDDHWLAGRGQIP